MARAAACSAASIKPVTPRQCSLEAIIDPPALSTGALFRSDDSDQSVNAVAELGEVSV